MSEKGKILEKSSSLEEKASSASLIKAFSIHGLYGYRTISMESPFSATIMIARNGAGKTTLINALYAVLKGQFSRLQGLDFSEIRCQLAMLDDEIVIRRSDIDLYFGLPLEGELAKQARRIEQDPQALLQFVTEEYWALSGDYRALRDHPVYTALERSMGYRPDEVRKQVERLNKDTHGDYNYLNELRLKIQAAMATYDIIYLPTYRRIELPLVGDPKDSAIKRRKASLFKQPSTSLLAGDIHFGLSDISEHLSDLNQRILFESNNGYRKISADIISEMIANDLDGAIKEEAIPKPEELNLFLSRLKESNRRDSFLDDINVPDIDLTFAASAKQNQSGKFLRYFLGKLNTVVQATRDVELQVQDFIDNCNKYLASQDLSASIGGDNSAAPSPPTPDDKVLRLNKKNLSVHAESLIGKRPISLNALSSGEKQMVSLFAKLYLYEKQKIVLIDEPEISLSIGWQRQILVDVLSAPRCKQVVAITHSPFVFDNVLDSFARSLQINVDLSALPENINLDEESDE
jgi:predicted ATPase